MKGGLHSIEDGDAENCGDDNVQSHLNTAQVPQMQNLSSMTNILNLACHTLHYFSHLHLLIRIWGIEISCVWEKSKSIHAQQLLQYTKK